MKQSNIFIFLLLLVLTFFLRDSLVLSTNLLSLFAPKEASEQLHLANKLGYSKEMFVSMEGFSKEQRERLDALADELRDVEGIESVLFETAPTQELRHYFKRHYALLADFKSKKLTSKEIHKRLLALKEKSRNALFYTPINRDDPLSLFSLKNPTKKRKKYLELENFGYLLKVKTEVAPSQMQEAKALYEHVHSVLERYPKALAFAPFFYSVENAQTIQKDVSFIILFSTLFLVLIYFVLLRDARLLFHIVVALGSSILFSLLLSVRLVEDFHILSLAFGTTLSAVSIDYFFHYYFHNYYSEKQSFNRSVFFGFITTVLAFTLLSFMDVKMIAQISLFSLLSLSFAYFLFSFVFVHLEIAPYKKEIQDSLKSSIKAPPSLITFVSLVLLVLAFTRVEFDTNIRNLDYQNRELQRLQKLFEGANKEALVSVVVEAKSKKELLERLHTIARKDAKSYSYANFVLSQSACKAKKRVLEHYAFKELKERLTQEARSLGFKEGYFRDAYHFTQELPSCSGLNLKLFHKLGLSLYEEGGTFYTLAMVEKKESVLALNGVSPVDIASLFARVWEGIFSEIQRYTLYVLLLILTLLFVSVRERFFYALNYILFPFALSFFLVSLLYSLNIMHLFAFIILGAIGIDYGIYMSDTLRVSRSMLAIKFSLLSTFGAFGVLIFSSINALFSIGLVITLGVLSIYFLIRVMR